MKKALKAFGILVIVYVVGGMAYVGWKNIFQYEDAQAELREKIFTLVDHR